MKGELFIMIRSPDPVSAYQFPNDPCLVDIGKSFAAPVMFIDKLLVLQAKQVQDRGMVICHLGAIFD